MKAPHSWFYQNRAGSFIPFSEEDSVRLEEGFRSEESVPISCDAGRRLADVRRRELRTVYWASDPCAIRRALWFWESGAEHWQPYTEVDSDRIENFLKSGAATNGSLVLNDGIHRIVSHDHNMDSESPHRALKGPYQHRVDGRGSVRKLHRGFPPGQTRRVRTDQRPARHLVLVIHGIGEHYFSKGGLSASESTVGSDGQDIGHVGSTERLRDTANTYNAGANAGTGGQNASEPAVSSGRVEFLPVLWASSVRPPAMLDRLNQVTLSSVSKMRDLANDVLLDGMLYTVPGTRKVIIETVVAEVNRIFNLFVANNPNFLSSGGHVSLLGHSLGSVIGFDVCSLQRRVDESGQPHKRQSRSSVENELCDSDCMQLDFMPHGLFLVGSPLGVFECVRTFGGKASSITAAAADAASAGLLGKDFCLPNCNSVFNIFEFDDPVAYRIEPLLKPELHKFEPEIIASATGTKSLGRQIKEVTSIASAALAKVMGGWFAGGATDSTKNEAPSPVSQGPIFSSVAADRKARLLSETALNHGEAVDYQLQERTLSVVGVGGSYINALSAHTSYWDNVDFALFLVSRL